MCKYVCINYIINVYFLVCKNFDTVVLNIVTFTASCSTIDIDILKLNFLNCILF